MNSQLRRASILLASSLLAGCSTIETAQRQAVRYNSAFSNARNEILLLNILRATHREPLQFSTISTVTGPMRGNISVTSAFEWVFHDNDKLTPGGGFTFRDPAITLTPLDTKEFRQGMMKEIEPEYFAGLLDQGWTPDVVLNLVAYGAIKCTAEPEPDAATIWVSAADAAKILKEGGGKEAKIKLASPLASSNDRVKVTFSAPAKSTVKTSLCPGGVIDVEATRFRSPLGMILFLGTGKSSEYMQIRQGRPQEPPFVSTLYRNATYYIPRDEKSAETLALLAEIIGFATTNAELSASKPTVTVPVAE